MQINKSERRTTDKFFTHELNEQNCVLSVQRIRPSLKMSNVERRYVSNESEEPDPTLFRYLVTDVFSTLKEKKKKRRVLNFVFTTRRK